MSHGERRIYLVENAYEAVIGRAVFEKVQEMKGRSEKKNRDESDLYRRFADFLFLVLLPARD